MCVCVYVCASLCPRASTYVLLDHVSGKCTDWLFSKSCNNLKCLFLLNMVLVLMIRTVDIYLIKRYIAFNSYIIRLFP